MTKELLDFYAACYTDDPKNPLCSPLFGDLTGLAAVASLCRAAMRSCWTTRSVLHQKLLDAGCKSTAASSRPSGGTRMCCTT